MPEGDQHRHHHPHEPRLPPRVAPRDRRRLSREAVLRRPLALALAAALIPASLRAQETAPLRLGAHGILAFLHADPVPGGEALGEVRVVQPVVMLHAGPFAGRRVGLLAMINLEGLTIPGGELAPGTWGEGFVDRRHPHTWVHELVVSAGESGLSLSAGKGFAPFGTDDPMSRPVLRYPVNHHLAQVLERIVVIGAVRRGPAILEAGLFNGDEPERPGQWPNVGRFGDSWSTRLTLLPSEGIELQASHAYVPSPEHRGGQGTTQRKWSASVRADRMVAGGRGYALAEWARSSEAGGFFAFSSWLVEAAWTRGRHRGHYRLERTERPEEQRTSDLFRSVRPHLDNSILGTTRWRIVTIGYSVDALATTAMVSAAPLVEVSLGDVSSLTPVSFDPAGFYGRDTFWSLSLGVRVGWGARLHRMGRYGAAAVTAGMQDHSH